MTTGPGYIHKFRYGLTKFRADMGDIRKVVEGYFYDAGDYQSHYATVRLALMISVLFVSIDILDIPSVLIQKHGKCLFVVIMIGALGSILLLFCELGLQDIVRQSPPSVMDPICLVALISSILYVLAVSFYGELYTYKKVIVGSFMAIVSVIIFFRVKAIAMRILKSTPYHPNTIDLKDIMAGDFSLGSNEILLVDERDVDYDILNRKATIDLLTSTILHVKPETSFVISLEGKWGSGKSTIIKNSIRELQKHEQLIIIDDFDPWTYQDQESLFMGLFGAIIEKSNLKYSYLSTRRLIDEVFDTVFGGRKVSFVKPIPRERSTIELMRKRINSHLESSGKKLVFFIDNIDRSESKNVIFLFKLVGHIFNLERVVYVLSFDSEEVRRAFETEGNMSYDYVKKVIQMQIQVPKIAESTLRSVIAPCIYNLLVAYGEEYNNLKQYEIVVDTLCSGHTDLRDFKRYINSVFCVTFASMHYLDKRDLLLIEYVRLHNPSLYSEIHQNREFFISHHMIDDIDVYKRSFDVDKFNVRAKDFFKDLFSDENNTAYVGVLANIFPYVERFRTNHDIQQKYLSQNSSLDVAKNRRICSGRYFDLYFSHTLNAHVLTTKLAEDAMTLIKSESDFTLIQNNFTELLLVTVPPYQHKELFEYLELLIVRLDEESAYRLFMILFEVIYLIDDHSGFLDLSARQRAVAIAADLLLMIDDYQFAQLLEDMEEQYQKLGIIRDLVYWLDSKTSIETSSNHVKTRLEAMINLCSQVASEIVVKEVNLYDDQYYYPHNIWGLAKILKDDRRELLGYVNKVLDKRSVFRLLYDITTETRGGSYRYYIRKDNLESLTTEQDIDQAYLEAVPVSEDERFISEVYLKYRNKELDAQGDPAIMTKERRILEL